MVSHKIMNGYSRIGKLDADSAEGWLLPHYRKWVQDRENFRAYGQNNFKTKLVALLRDSLDLPLPPDRDPAYSDRVLGSLLPHVRLRCKADGAAKGIIEWASLRRAGQLTEQACDVATPVSDGCDEGDEAPQPAIGDEKHLPKAARQKPPVAKPRKKGCDPKSITSITSVSHGDVQGSLDVLSSSQVGSGADVDSGDDPHWPKRGAC